MPLENLERLVEKRLLSRHQPAQKELENHLQVARQFLRAARLDGAPEAREGIAEVSARLR